MSRRASTDQGFSAIEAIIIVVIIAVIGLGGFLVWRHNHTKKAATTTSNNAPQQKQQSSNTQTADPYAGWKTYCDNYHYCFKYPTNWALTVQMAAQGSGDAGQVTVTSPDSAVELLYMNVNNHDGAMAAYTPAVSATSLLSANQSLSIIGGYAHLSSSYYPSYDIVDSSLLTTYPLSVDRESQIPQPPEFTDQGTAGNTASHGSFSATPSKPLTSLTDAKTWFNSSEAQTSLQILKSFNYKNN